MVPPEDPKFFKMNVYKGREKPQGFEQGKRAKQGIFSCPWGCQKEFGSQKEASFHWETENCSGMQSSNARVEEMFAQERRMGRTNLQPISIGRQQESEEKHTKKESYDGILTKTRTEADMQFGDYLKSLLQEIDKIIYVEQYLRTSTFRNHW